MDRENVLAKYPTTTQQREKWDNSRRVSNEQLDIMKYVLNAASHMEFGLHGTGHEYWADDGI
jgi:phage terminase large subunit GpA-like protein